MKNILFAYEKKDSFLHRSDPLSKLIWLFCFSSLALLITDALHQFILFLLVIFIANILAKIAVKEFGFIVAMITSFVACWFFIQSQLIGGNQILIEIGTLKLTYEGVDAAGAVALRTLIMVMLARIFIGSTEARELALALTQKWKMPYSVAFSIFYIIRILPLFEQEFEELQDSRKVRASEIDFRHKQFQPKIFNYIRLLLFRGFRRCIVTSYSLDSRAFRSRPDRTYLTEVEYTKEGKILMVMSVMVTLISFLLLFIV
jgi:energy-coupling factor transport system permease protein